MFDFEGFDIVATNGSENEPQLRWPWSTGEHAQWAFRIWDHRASDGEHCRLFLEAYKIQRRTPTGFIINDGLQDRFIHYHWKKKFAHTSVEEAIDAWKARKRKQLQYVTNYYKYCLNAADVEPLYPKG